MLLGLFVLGAANSVRPAVRFASPVLDDVAALAVVLLPWGALAALGRVPGRRLRWGLGVALAPVLLLTLPGACFLAFDLRDDTAGPVPALEVVRQLAVGAGRVRVYRATCGVPCSNTLVVRHERAVLPGVLVVRTLDIGADGDAGLATDARGSRVTVTLPDEVTGAVREPETFALRPWVYF